jgi:signal transduction histidine kinase
VILISQFFDQNQQLILFVYGLTFFVMGLAIMLQGRRASRLELARSLGWLAAFGIAHGLNEWGDLFIPIQAGYTPQPIVRLFYVVQLILLGVSFAFLFQFGVSLLNTLGRGERLRSLPLILFCLWLFVTFFVLTTVVVDTRTWYRTSNSLARYFIAFPAGLLAAYGLREHAIKRIAPLQVPVIYNTLRIAGLLLFLYAIFSGLIPPPVSFLPGSILNTSSFENWTGVPPMAIRSLIGIVLVLVIIRALEIFQVETDRRIEALEQRSIINAERERIARDLHDGAIQKVYTAGLLVESASKLAATEPELAIRLDRAQTVLNDSISDLRRNLTELNPNSSPDPEPLATHLERIASNPDYAAMVKIRLDMKIAPDASLGPVRTGHLLSILNEALSNIVRHADARRVLIQAEDIGEALRIVVSDDGVGLSGKASNGYGLRNMHDRARLLNGQLDIQNAAPKGTLVTIELPWSD